MKYFFLCSIFLFNSCNLAPGSYPYAERYEMNMVETDLRQKINNFKLENLEYQIPKGSGFIDGKRSENDHWFHIYFYYEVENIIVKTWVRQKSEITTIFAFVGIKEYSKNTSWKMVNRDFDDLDNQKILDEFEKRILKELRN